MDGFIFSGLFSIALALYLGLKAIAYSIQIAAQILSETMAQFEVKMKCVVYKTVTVECDTEEEAENNPWDHAVDEMETGQVT